jgi:hypothetical protein
MPEARGLRRKLKAILLQGAKQNYQLNQKCHRRVALDGALAAL